MPPTLLLAYYGDDFTGSTDVMEALSRAGLRTVLFLRPPTAGALADFPGLRAFGVAGGSRTMSPEEMERELPPAFESLKASGAPVVHYKMCSTFDSSPHVGSVGRAIELGRRVFGDRPTPLVVGAPVLGRYVVFGNLFARSGLDTEPFRLDRHPTMSRHPVTPMNEAELRRILGAQTRLPVHLVDVLWLEAELSSDVTVQLPDRARSPGAQRPIVNGYRQGNNRADQAVFAAGDRPRAARAPEQLPSDNPVESTGPGVGAAIRASPFAFHAVGDGGSSAGRAGESPAPIVLFDTLREAHLAVIGREIARLAGDKPLFVVGSSGIEYALAAHWREAAKSGEPMGPEGRGRLFSAASPGLRLTTPIAASVPPVDQLLCVSGSCSPVTDRQIARAIEAGFREIPVQARQLARSGYCDAIRTAVLLESQRTLSGSRGVILHTSRGPGDLRIVRGRKTLAALSANLGPSLARLLEDLIEATGIRRAVVCGGDTSMAVARALGIMALEYVAPIAPGCPLCRVHAPGRVVHGCEIAFKGGQVGRDPFFQDALGAGEK